MKLLTPARLADEHAKSLNRLIVAEHFNNDPKLLAKLNRNRKGLRAILVPTWKKFLSAHGVQVEFTKSSTSTHQ